MPLDLDFVRSQFPGLDSEWTFMDNAGGSLTLERVADRIRDYLLRTDVQLGASYEISRLAGERVDRARGAVRELFGAAEDREVAFGASTTVLLKFLAQALRSRLRAGDEIVVTNVDHEANIGPWLPLEELGVEVRFWTFDPETLRLETEDLKKLLSPRTKLLCVTHTSNILGSIEPIEEWARLVHECGGMICVDGVAHAPHRRLRVRDWDVDFYVFSLYKTYGPHLAALYGKAERLLELDNLYHFFVPREKIPAKLEPGNPCYELAHGCGGITEYLTELGGGSGPGDDALTPAFETIAEHEESLCARLLGFLRERPGVRVIGPDVPDRNVRVPTISFVVDGRSSKEIVDRVDPHFIGIRHGDFYARRLIDDLGLSSRDGVVRVSLVHYNTLEEVDRLLEVLDGVI